MCDRATECMRRAQRRAVQRQVFARQVKKKRPANTDRNKENLLHNCNTNAAWIQSNGSVKITPRCKAEFATGLNLWIVAHAFTLSYDNMVALPLMPSRTCYNWMAKSDRRNGMI